MHQKELLEGLSPQFFVLVHTYIRTNGNLVPTDSLLYGLFLREKLLFYYIDNYNSSNISKGNSINCTLRLLTFCHWHFYIGKLCDTSIKV